jgi:hypothetical protein
MARTLPYLLQAPTIWSTEESFFFIGKILCTRRQGSCRRLTFEMVQNVRGRSEALVVLYQARTTPPISDMDVEQQ